MGGVWMNECADESPSAPPGFAPEGGLVGHLHHHLIEELHVPGALGLLVHPHDVGAFALHLDHPPAQPRSRQQQRHLHAGLALEGEVGAALGLFGEGVLDDGDAGDGAAVLEDHLQFLPRGLVVHVLDEDGLGVLAPPLLQLLGVLLRSLLGLHGVLPRGVDCGLGLASLHTLLCTALHLHYLIILRPNRIHAHKFTGKRYRHRYRSIMQKEGRSYPTISYFQLANDLHPSSLANWQFIPSTVGALCYAYIIAEMDGQHPRSLRLRQALNIHRSTTDLLPKSRSQALRARHAAARSKLNLIARQLYDLKYDHEWQERQLQTLVDRGSLLERQAQEGVHRAQEAGEAARGLEEEGLELGLGGVGKEGGLGSERSTEPEREDSAVAAAEEGSSCQTGIRSADAEQTSSHAELAPSKNSSETHSPTKHRRSVRSAPKQNPLRQNVNSLPIVNIAIFTLLLFIVLTLL